MLREYKETE